MEPTKDRIHDNLSDRSIGRVQGASPPSDICVRTSV